MRANINVLVATVLWGYVSALPADGTITVRGRELVARGAKLDPSCSDVNPFKDSEQMADKVNQALADVQTIAKEVTSGQVIKGDVTYRMSDAFNNYFADEEYDDVMKMMTVMANLDKYDYNIMCGSKMDTVSCAQGSFAATNPNAGSPNIVLCDKFFDPAEEEVKRNLKDRTGTNKRTGWCQTDAAGNPSEKFPFFAVAGLTLFHEITHIDLIGVAAELTQRTLDGITSHGTVDVYENGGPDHKNRYKRPDDSGQLKQMKPYDAARLLKVF